MDRRTERSCGSFGITEDEAIAFEAEAGMAAFASEDAKEGPRAVAEKRRRPFPDA